VWSPGVTRTAPYLWASLLVALSVASVGEVAGRGLIEQLDLGTRRLIALRISAHSRIFNAHGRDSWN
jgi:hypothetical protein